MTQRKLQITTGSATKYYDEKPLTNESFTVTMGKLADGHKISITITGCQISEGSSLNFVDRESFTVVDSKGNDVTGNYTLIKGYDEYGDEIWDINLGTLTVY